MVAPGPSPVCTFGGVVLDGQRSYDFPLQYGTAAAEVLWTVSNSCAEQLEPLRGQPADLILQTEQREYFHRLLYLLEVLPGNKFTKRVRVADLRWLWPYRHVAANFNVRRTAGERFLVRSDHGPPELDLSEPELFYEPTTLHPFGPQPGTAPWSFKQVIERVLSGNPDRGEGLGETPALSFDEAGVSVPIEDFFLDDPGDAAIDRALRYGPGIDLYVSPSGAVVVVDTRDEEGEEVARRTRPGRIATGPESLEVVREAIRPSAIYHLFTVNAEVKFGFSESTTITEPDQDQPDLYNVAEVTDKTVTVGGKELARGSIAQLLDLFSAWGSFGLNNEPLSLAFLRENRLEHGGGFIEKIYSVDANETPDAEFQARAVETVQAWRKKYLIDRVFFGRLGSVVPVRAAIVNAETGRRARAAVYCDYIRRPSIRGLTKDPTLTLQGAAIQGYNGTIGATTQAAPFTVSPVNESGVFEIAPKLPVSGVFDELIPGFAVDGIIPVIDGFNQATRTGVGAYMNWGLVDLRQQFDLAVIMSVTPATPHGHGRFYAIKTVVPGGNGPPLYSRIYPGVAVARFAWDEDRADEIIGAIKGDGTNDWELLSDLLVDANHIVNVANANHQRILDIFRDRTVGGHDVSLDPSLEPVGSLGSVRHIMADGAMVSQCRWQSPKSATTLWRYLDSSTRLFLQGALGGYPRASD